MSQKLTHDLTEIKIAPKMMNNLIYLSISLLLFTNLNSFAQSEIQKTDIRYNKYLEIGIQHGNSKTSSTTLFNQINDIEDLGLYRSISLKYNFETVGKKKWEEIYGYSTYGFGVNIFDFFTPKSTGYPISVFGFFNPNVYKYKRFSFNGLISLGMSFNWKHYGFFNLDNNAISLARTVYIELGAAVNYELSDKLILSLCGLVGHFSNGATRRPNLGINNLGLQYSVKYLLNHKKQPLIHHAKETFTSTNNFLLSLHFGTQNFQVDSLNDLVEDKFKGINFVMWGITGEYQRQITNYSKFGFGINIFDDGSVGATYIVEGNEIEESKILPIHQRLKISIFPSYELVLHKFGIVFQSGLYIIKNSLAKDVPTFYQRIGARYNVNRNLFFGVSLRAYSFKSANFIEYSTGYKF